MKQDTLSDLIRALVYGTKLQISVVFLEHYGNKKTQLPFEQKTHQAPVCNAAKQTPEGYATCVRCRNMVLRLLQRRKTSLAGFCPNGVYEYCRPVLRGDRVAAVIFIGNILAPGREDRPISPALQKTMQKNYSTADCIRTADLLERYILFLLDAHGDTEKQTFDPLLENLKTYLEENLFYGLSVQELAKVFRYDEKYLGRLFKSKTGHTVREYCNLARIERAKTLLLNDKSGISAIAAQSGYNNVTYFNRVFKQVTGCSPQQFRKESGQV